MTCFLLDHVCFRFLHSPQAVYRCPHKLTGINSITSINWWKTLALKGEKHVQAWVLINYYLWAVFFHPYKPNNIICKMKHWFHIVAKYSSTSYSTKLLELQRGLKWASNNSYLLSPYLIPGTVLNAFNQWLSTGCDFYPLRTFGNIWWYFWLSQLQLGVGRSGESYWHLNVWRLLSFVQCRGQFPTTKNYLVNSLSIQNVNSAYIEKCCFKCYH